MLGILLIVVKFVKQLFDIPKALTISPYLQYLSIFNPNILDVFELFDILY